MLRGLYAAASGLQVGAEHQEVTAHNLAHAPTPGYRARGTVVESFDRALNRAAEPTGDAVGARVAAAYHDFTPGAFRQTGSPFDLALADPNQFFSLDGPNGTLYTRNGSFRLDDQGRLVSPAGYPLRGENEAIEIPPDATRVVVALDGSVTADGVPVGQIRPTRFADLRALTAAGPTLYTAAPAAGPQDADGRVVQGTLEGSNVQPADAMVQLLISARFYDAAQRSLRALSESVQQNTRPQG